MKRSLAGAVAGILFASSAFSADLYQPQPVPEQPPEVAIAETSGWYLRGDVGYAFNDMRGAHFFQGSNGDVGYFDSTDLDDSWTLGGGVGYQINSYLRTDLTFDYLFDSDFRGSTSGGGAAFGACVGPCTSRDISSLTAYSLLANAYVDLGTYGYVTPYVGAGIGGTHVKWNDLNNTSCADDGSSCDDTVSHGGRDSWRFTYALMAGASIDVSCNVKADIGYRYRHVDGGDMFGFAENGGPGTDDGFNIHEARLGARYLFGGCPQPVAYEPPPAPPLYK